MKRQIWLINRDGCVLDKICGGVDGRQSVYWLAQQQSAISPTLLLI